MKPVFLRILRGYLVFITPILFIIGSTRLLMTPAWLNFEYTRAGFLPDPYGFTTQDRQQYGIYGIEYLLNGEEINYLAELTLPAEKCVEGSIQDGQCPMFNAGALRHMEDVKKVTQAAYLFGIISAFLAAVSSYYLWHKDRHHLRQALWYGSLFTFGLIVTIITISTVAWDFFFDTFHAIFFQDGTWQFYYSDTLIRLYPEQFWFESAVAIGIMTCFWASLLWIAAGQRGTKHR